MYSIRKWIFRPKRSDQSLLAGFFYADEELNMVATELDSFDGRKDPERCTTLVNQLRMCQDKVLSYMERIMDDCVPLERASRDFRVKFPDDVLQESLSGQLWFGAECLAAGSSIMNREVESASMRPLAKALTRHLDYLRALLRDQCLRNINTYTDRIKDSLILFDRLFAEFEISYVSAMVPVKTMKEYDVMQEVIVLFSETTQRALRLNLLTQDMIDDYDPALMFTIPRLAIVAGLLVYPEGALNPDMDPVNMSEMFRPFQTLLYKIRELLWTLSKEELWLLEKSLCSAEEQGLYRDMANIPFPDDLDPYQDLSVEHLSELTLDGAMGLDLDTEGGMMVGRLLSVDPKYGCMSQSPSTMTLVANPDYEAFADEAVNGDVEESCQRVHMAKEAGGMRHQDSADSGMLSENGSLLGVVPAGYERVGGSRNESVHGTSRSSVRDSRSLRHSVSWPEATLRPRCRARYHDADTSPLGLLEDSGEREGARQQCTHSHEFNFHLPLNTTETTSESPANRAWERTPTNAVDLGSTRVFYMTDCCDEEHCLSSSTQISYVTETLNEVFVTDTSTFQQSFISAVTSKALTESMGICCKCGMKTCGTHIRDQGRGGSNNVDQSVEDQMNLSNTDQGIGDQYTTAEIGDDGTTTSDGTTIVGSCDDCDRCSTGNRDEHHQSEGCRTALQDDALHKGDRDHVMTPCGEEDINTMGGDQDTLTSRVDQSLSPLAVSEQCELMHGEVASCQTTTASTEERVAVMATLLVSPSSSEDEKANDEPSEKCVARDHTILTPTQSCEHCKCGSMLVDGCDSNSTTNNDSAEHSVTCRLGIMSPTLEAEGFEESCRMALCSKGEQALRSCLEVPRVQRLRYADGPTMMCSSCNRSRRSSVTSTDVDWDRESYNSSETSSYNSDCHDDEEIALAIQAAELASRREARSRFKSSHDLIHRLFVCISGVADQLQTNYASDLRHILKAVFECNSSEPFLSFDLQGESSDDSENLNGDDGISREQLSQEGVIGERLVEEQYPTEQVSGEMESDNPFEAPRDENRSLRYRDGEPTTSDDVDPPKWVPDHESPHCESCEALFTFMRRRHHCRNCGKIFCGRCSSNAVPLPHYGHTKPVRVCNHCFMFQVNPFMVDE